MQALQDGHWQSAESCMSAADVLAAARVVAAKRRAFRNLPPPIRIATRTKIIPLPRQKIIPLNSIHLSGIVVGHFPFQEPSKPEPRIVWTVREIQKGVCQVFGCTIADLQSPRRRQPLVIYRQIAMALAYKLSKRSLPEIGRHFGGRDHTTVLHAWRKYQAVYEALEPTMPLGASPQKWTHEMWQAINRKS